MGILTIRVKQLSFTCYRKKLTSFINLIIVLVYTIRTTAFFPLTIKCWFPSTISQNETCQRQTFLSFQEAQQLFLLPDDDLRRLRPDRPDRGDQGRHQERRGPGRAQGQQHHGD